MNFQKITEDLLFLENNYGQLRIAVNDFYCFLSDIVGLNDDSLEQSDNKETILDDGKAISLKDAARCIWDIDRTTIFLRGIYAAIIEAKKRFPNEKIEILYAGCGPFATLAVPLCNQFSPDEIGFTLIDIHEQSIDNAKKVFEKLGIEDFVCDFIKTDATKFKNEKGNKFHIIFAEVMQRALDTEPQVAVTLQLVPHLKENGIFIPQKILIEACLINMGKDIGLDEFDGTKKERVYLGQIFELSLTTVSAGNLLSPKTIKVPKGDLKHLNMALLTKISVFERFKLDDYDSGLNYPKFLFDLENISNSQKIEFQYILGTNPQFEYRLL